MVTLVTRKAADNSVYVVIAGEVANRSLCF